MDGCPRIVTVDWRRFGGTSAVGQLKQKLFSQLPDVDLYAIEVHTDHLCSLFKRGEDGSMYSQFQTEVRQDVILKQVRGLAPSLVYVRLSPQLPTLELATKLFARLPHTPFVVHYMDAPFIEEHGRSRRAYIEALYAYLTARAKVVYGINDAGSTWLRERFDRNAYTLGNFIESVPSDVKHLTPSNQQPVRVSYFGSIDSKMNAEAVREICRLVARQPWVSLTIWSNNPAPKDVGQMAREADNITLNRSRLSVDDYAVEIRASDVALLPYNSSEDDIHRLRHSFSNKLVDYISAGVPILAYGSRSISSVAECERSGVGVVCEDYDSLKTLLSSKDRFLEALGTVEKAAYLQGAESLRIRQLTAVDRFISHMKQLSVQGIHPASRRSSASALSGSAAGSAKKHLGFLIRRQFLDFANGDQSLATTLAAELMRRRGFNGFDYEI